jgi:hypothetical protein
MAMQLPMVLDQIIEELVMSVGIFNFLKCLKKILKAIGVSLRLHSGTNIVVETWQVQPSLILEDHVV